MAPASWTRQPQRNDKQSGACTHKIAICSGIAGRKLCAVPPDVQAIFWRRRHQPSKPPLAKVKPGSPAPAMGPGTAAKPSLFTKRRLCRRWSPVR